MEFNQLINNLFACHFDIFTQIARTIFFTSETFRLSDIILFIDSREKSSIICDLYFIEFYIVPEIVLKGDISSTNLSTIYDCMAFALCAFIYSNM